MILVLQLMKTTVFCQESDFKPCPLGFTLYVIVTRKLHQQVNVLA